MITEKPLKKIYCFDIDGTLLSTHRAGSRSFKKAIVDMYAQEPDWKSISMAGRLDPGIFKEILFKIGRAYTHQDWENFKEKYLNYLIQESADISKWVVFPGVRETLEKLKNQRERMILLTGNIREGARVKLETVGLAHYFDWEGSVFGCEGQDSRDDLATVYQSKHPAATLPVVIGDTPADIRIGRLLSGVSVAVATGMHSVEELSAHNPDKVLMRLELD